MRYRGIFGHRRRPWRGAGLGMLLGLLCFLLAACAEQWEYDPITDVSDLQGRRVGVNLSWETDYALSGRNDLQLFRYDSIADQLMALNYDKLDALAMDAFTWRAVSANSKGLVCIEPAFGETGYLLYFSSANEALKDDFNTFLAVYRTTDEYRDLLAREAAFDGLNYVGPEIPLTGSGPVLRVTILADGFPRSFRDPGDIEPKGYDLEALKHFANARNYRLEFIVSTYEDGFMGLMSGLYDIQAGYLSDVYAEEVETAGLFVSDNMDQVPLYFVQKTQRDISAEMDEIE